MELQPLSKDECRQIRPGEALTLGTVVLVFTIVEQMTSTRIRIISKTYSMMTAGTYDKTSAMLWFYFLVVGGVMGILIFMYNRAFMRRWDN